MDSTVSSAIYSIVKDNWSYFFTTNPQGCGGGGWCDSAGNGQSLRPSEFLGYAGGALAFFLPCMGAWQAAAKIIGDLEDGMDSFLEEFGGDKGNRFKELAEDSDKLAAMEDFLQTYTWNLIILLIASFWHILFNITFGWFMALWIFNHTWALVTAADLTVSKSININIGWKLLFWGMFYGTVGYLGGIALEFSNESLIKLVGYNGEEGTTSQTTNTVKYPTAGGQTTTTTVINTKIDYHKDFFNLSHIWQEWTVFFLSQRAVQLTLPYLYIAFCELATILVWGLTIQYFDYTTTLTVLISN